MLFWTPLRSLWALLLQTLSVWVALSLNWPLVNSAGETLVPGGQGPGSGERLPERRFEEGRNGVAGPKRMGKPELCLRRREVPQEASCRARLELWEWAGCQAAEEVSEAAQYVLCILCVIGRAVYCVCASA